MATLITLRPSAIRACASSGGRESDTHRPKSQSTNWWTPLFGWSSDPDYIDDTGSGKALNVSHPDPDTTRVRSRFSPGSFTDEKAKQLRMKTAETANFHDIMYHSAIASRLASDLSDRSDL
ncbi:uncharacterized protein LOC143858916 [Tasmannia lanceolata]|uniref:uncharacterized protein LOC143858916 n=1 Tax=Tasmannia lanceolata TaxID=3420 RepID=UPI004064099A